MRTLRSELRNEINKSWKFSTSKKLTNQSQKSLSHIIVNRFDRWVSINERSRRNWYFAGIVRIVFIVNAKQCAVMICLPRLNCFKWFYSFFKNKLFSICDRELVVGTFEVFKRYEGKHYAWINPQTHRVLKYHNRMDLKIINNNIGKSTQL